jgi:hypothetical protein
LVEEFDGFPHFVIGSGFGFGIEDLSELAQHDGAPLVRP